MTVRVAEMRSGELRRTPSTAFWRRSLSSTWVISATRVWVWRTSAVVALDSVWAVCTRSEVVETWVITLATCTKEGRE